jgi:hypothetical protein
MKTKRRIIIALGLACLALVAAGWHFEKLYQQEKAKIAKTRAQFSQWATAMEMFNAEYGYFPPIDGNYSGGGTARVNLVNSEKFSVALTGRHLDGIDADLRIKSATVEKKVGNTKLIAFYTIAEGELDGSGTATTLHDYFGNTDIAVLYDKTGDGIINGSDIRTLPTVCAKGGGTFTPGPEDFNLNKGLNVPVAFYSAGKGRSDGGKIESKDAVFSWK